MYRVDYNVKELGQMLLIIFALYAPVKVENMIPGGGSSWQLIIVARFRISRIKKIILQNMKSGKAGDSLKKLMSAS